MPHPNVTILLLDDSAEDRVAYRRYLQCDSRYSYTIVEANSAEIALEYCRKSPPDLILLDYLLSDMDGLEFLEQLQQLIPIATLPILMITGQGNENVAVQALKKGVKDYIIKDQITCDDLCHRVHLVLEKIFLVKQIQQQQIEAELRSFNQQIEERVQGRTGALQHTNERLQQEISTRQIAETLFRTSQIRFKKLAANIPGVIFQYLFKADGQGIFTYVSSGCQNLLELEANDLLKNSRLIEQLIHPDDLATLPWFFREVTTTLDQWEQEFRMIMPSGQVKWIRGTASRLRQENQNIVCEGLFVDISDRKEAEQELLEQKYFLHSIIDANPSWIFVTDLQGKVLLVNETMAHFYGKSISEIIHKNLDEILHPLQQHSSQQISHFFTSQIPEETQQTFELSMVTTTGEERYFQGFKFLLTDADGRVKGRLGIVSDITKRQLIENALQQQIEQERLLNTVTQRLRESLNLQEILNNAAHETYKILQSDRMLIYQILEDNRGKVIAETCSTGCICLFHHIFDAETFPVSCYEQYRQGKIYSLADRSLRTEPICLQEFMETYQIQAKLIVPIVENDRLWGLLVAHQCFQPRQWQPWEINLLQQLASQLAIAIQQSKLYKKLQIELKERQEAELQLQTTNEQLKLTNQALAEATRLKDEFLANMSHELRTPLNAILGMSEGLLEEVYGSLNEKQRRSLTTVQRSGQHLLELINDILDLAKIESGKVKLEMSPVSLYQLCDYSLAFIRPQAQKKRIQLITELLPKDCFVFLDQRQIRQVLINLLSNAVKFTPEGGKITLRVRIESSPQTAETSLNLDVSEMLVFEVEDRGIGITPSDQDKLFQSFVQLDNSLSRTHAGTGLGLAMVRRITELHQGCVSVSSKLGEGSCFSVKIPYITPRPPGENLGTVAGSPSKTPGLGDIHPPLTIPLANSPLLLLAEDNESNIIMISEYLDCKGYRVVVARNGLEAIKIAQQQQPELILMDISMPKMDGLTAIGQIRANSEIATIPIIALTALAMPGDEERCLAVGANAYLTKPIRLVQLSETMQSLLSTQRS